MNVEDIFSRALQIQNQADRAAYLEKACAGDSQLRERVESLLAAHQEAASFLENSAKEISAQTTRPAEGSEPAATIRPTTYRPITEGPGTIIGHYKLLQSIGEGGMGVVYMAEQEKPVRRRVALKIIKPGMDSQQVIARFEAERQALAMMDHPNIARVFDAGCTDTGRPYFVMELVQGIPITKYCDDKQLDTGARLDLFVQVCQAVQHAHQKGIIHRDLKPSNVLIAIYDAKLVPKIIDFGVAKALHQRLTEKTMFTQFGAVVGTLEYMSPEQADMDLLGTDTRSDIYSLGVLLYELLTGSTPIDGKKLRSLAYGEMLKTIREVDPPKPSTRLSLSVNNIANISAQRHTEPRRLQKLIAGDLDWIVMKCLEKDRTRRYETATGLAQDIQRHLQDEAVSASPPGQLYKFQKLVRRNKLTFAAIAAITLSLVIGLAASLWQAQRAQRESERASREADQARSAESQERSAESEARATLDELRATAPTFAAEARALAAKGQFDQAIEKLDYATTLRPDAPEFRVAKGDLYLCQLKLPDADTVYRDALRLSPSFAPAQAKAQLCDQILAAPRSPQGKLSLESLVKIWPALEPEKRSDAELGAIRNAYAGEHQRLWNYWLQRLKSLPAYANVPLTSQKYRFFEIRKDGQLIIYGNAGLRFSDLSQLKDLPIAELYLGDNRYVTDVQALADMPSLEDVTLPPLARNIESLRKLPKLKRLSFSWVNCDPSGERSHYFSPQGQVDGDLMHRMSLFNIDGVLERPMPDTTAEEFWKEYSTLSWMSRLRDSAIKPSEFTRQADGTWRLIFENKKELADLSFLHGMPISVLSLGGTSVTDLSPLRGMPLKELYLWSTNVTDLTPIKSMPINHLDMGGDYKISDLSPIKGMPLDYLSLVGSQVSDLSPLRGMPLTRLRLKDCANLTDLSPLADTKQLTLLDLPPNCTDFEALRTLPKLQRLSFDTEQDNGDIPDKTTDQFWAEHPSWAGKLKAAGIDFSLKQLSGGYYDKAVHDYYDVTVHDPKFTDCSIFKGSNVRRLDLDKSQVTDLSPLADLPLAALSLGETPVKDLSPLRSPTLRDSLRELRVSKTKVTDFSPVAGCAKLELFDAADTQLIDLTILHGMPISVLSLGGTPVTDLSPLAGMGDTLETVILPPNAKNIEFLRKFPKLTQVSFQYDPNLRGPAQTAEEFWFEYDRNQKAAATQPVSAASREP